MPDTDQDQDHEPGHGPNLILDVENFGPIAEAKNIEFRPMTVFVGPSNTGKSYLARLLHAILKAKNGDSLRPNAVPPSVSDYFGTIDQSELNAYVSEIQTFVETQSDRRSTVMHFDKMSENLQGFVASATKDWLNSLATRAITEVEHYFQRDLTQIVTSDSSGAPMLTRAFTCSREWLMTFYSDSKFHASSIENVNLDIDRRFRFDLLRYDDRDPVKRHPIVSSLLNALDESIANRMNAFVRSHYAPAGRTGILASRAVLTSAILANLSSAQIYGLEIGQLDPIVGEFLSSLAGSANAAVNNASARPSRLMSWRSQRPGMLGIANLMSSKLLHGRIESKSGLDDGSYDYVTESFRGPLERASSMVTEIAPLALSIRNRVRGGELLIIDEPEAHLHPEAQQRMAAMLAYIVQVGVRVLITTHSHYFVEQLGALVNAGDDRVDPDERERHLGLLGRQIDRDLYLKQDEVAVYEFEPGTHNGAPANVRELPFDGDHLGYYPLGYSKALTDQRNRNVHMIGAREGF